MKEKKAQSVEDFIKAGGRIKKIASAGQPYRLLFSSGRFGAKASKVGSKTGIAKPGKKR